jgi:hypothetical protein
MSSNEAGLCLGSPAPCSCVLKNIRISAFGMGHLPPLNRLCGHPSSDTQEHTRLVKVLDCSPLRYLYGNWQVNASCFSCSAGASS